ncbi:hypothetical protein ACTFRP_29045 [Bacillus cereus group sp. MYBK234-1]|uniref:hypothetical protein n=1 Tax=unclassified Bacillus cereus group TaxID=2750818 RepID=UPI003F7A55B5
MAPKLVQKYLLCAATETITKLYAHPTRIRYTLLSLLFWCRKMEIIDHLAELLDGITHKFGNRAKTATKTEII